MIILLRYRGFKIVYSGLLSFTSRFRLLLCLCLMLLFLPKFSSLVVSAKQRHYRTAKAGLVHEKKEFQSYVNYVYRLFLSLNVLLRSLSFHHFTASPPTDSAEKRK